MLIKPQLASIWHHSLVGGVRVIYHGRHVFVFHLAKIFFSLHVITDLLFRAKAQRKIGGMIFS